MSRQKPNMQNFKHKKEKKADMIFTVKPRLTYYGHANIIHCGEIKHIEHISSTTVSAKRPKNGIRKMIKIMVIK